jgi:hypothetical protein
VYKGLIVNSAIDAASLMSGGPMPDMVPLLTCVCRDPKIDAATKCLSACGGGTSSASMTTQRDNVCKDPKAFVDQISSFAAKFSGGWFSSNMQPTG